MMTRIALVEDALSRLRNRQGVSEDKVADVAESALVESVKGKWHTMAIVVPGMLALIAQALAWIFKGHV